MGRPPLCNCFCGTVTTTTTTTTTQPPDQLYCWSDMANTQALDPGRLVRLCDTWNNALFSAGWSWELSNSSSLEECELTCKDQCYYCVFCPDTQVSICTGPFDCDLGAPDISSSFPGCQLTFGSMSIHPNDCSMCDIYPTTTTTTTSTTTTTTTTSTTTTSTTTTSTTTTSTTTTSTTSTTTTEQPTTTTTTEQPTTTTTTEQPTTTTTTTEQPTTTTTTEEPTGACWKCDCDTFDFTCTITQQTACTGAGFFFSPGFTCNQIDAIVQCGWEYCTYDPIADIYTCVQSCGPIDGFISGPYPPGDCDSNLCQLVTQNPNQ